MACSNCYTGCTDIVSDKCVQYTGVDVPLLDIRKGDSLSYVEQALITFLTSTINGSGIKIEIDEELYCEVVSQYLPTCSTITALDLFKALVQAACSLQEAIDAENARIDTIEANYTIECLTGVTSSSGTHAIVQAIITKLCTIDTSLTALALDVETNYVAISEINSYIAAYIAANPIGNRYYSRMVPYSILPYYGSLSNFDSTGAGLGQWEQIYLCNGENNTPDLRGRTVVGAVSGVPGGSLSPVVNPASNPTFNPNYALGDLAGANSVTLTIPQIPIHSHGVTDPTHNHALAASGAGSTTLSVGQTMAVTGDVSTDDQYTLSNSGSTATLGVSGAKATGISIQNTGSGEAHDNKQPSLATYFIIHIPS